MEIFAKILSVTDGNMVLETDDELDIHELLKYSNGEQPTVGVSFDDKRKISRDQQKKIYALLKDVADWTGYSPLEAEIVFQSSFLTEDELKEFFKFEIMMSNHIEYFSLSDCSMSVAHDFLAHMLDVCFANKIPFKTKVWDSIPSDYPRMLKALENRICCVCGKHADIAHYDTVGSGNNRKTDTRSHYLMSLCRVCHSEQHNVGVITFCSDIHHIKPIKVTADTYHRLVANKQIMWEETIEIAS